MAFKENKHNYVDKEEEAAEVFTATSKKRRVSGDNNDDLKNDSIENNRDTRDDGSDGNDNDNVGSDYQFSDDAFD
jgi:hypothetical protein